MGSRYEVEVTVGSARDLKNVNWRNGDLKPYAVLWVDDAGARVSTRVDLDNGESPAWDEKVLVPLPPSSRLQDAVLHLDVVHANAAEGVKPLVGSARLPLRDVLDDAGVGGRASRSLRLKRPSGRPHGRLDVRVAVREPNRYYDASNSNQAAGYQAYPQPGAAAYGSSRDAYGAPGGGGYGGGYGAGGYGAAYGAAAPPAGYPAYGAAAPAYGAAAPAYGAPPLAQTGYGSAQPAYGESTTAYADPAKKKKGLGMGGGLAVGAAAGVLGGLALAGGASYLEDKFEDHVAEKVEEEEEYGGGGGGYDDYGGDDDY